MQAVLLVAGRSTRTYPLTLTRPKPLLPLVNRPLIEHSLEQMTGLFDQVILIVGYRQEMIRQHLGSRYKGMQLIYQVQAEQLGTGHAVLQARPHISGPFVALNGDDLFDRVDLERLSQYDYAALAKRVPDPSQYGVFRVDGKNRVLDLVEKPKSYLGDLANIGGYILQPEFFDALERTPKSERNEIEITSTIQSVAQTAPFTALPIRGNWRPTGYAWDLLGHQEALLSSMESSKCSGTVEKGALLTGPVIIDDNSTIRSGAVIEGPAVIGRECDIGPNCYIRKNTVVGDRCRIGQAVEIKNALIMDDVQIAHLSYVGDSIVGCSCNLGAGTITANRRHDGNTIRSEIKGELIDTGRAKLGAILGDGVHTGIHTSIYPGRKLWPGTWTRPGAVVDRDLIS